MLHATEKPKSRNDNFVWVDFESNQELNYHKINYAIAIVQTICEEGKQISCYVFNDRGGWLFSRFLGNSLEINIDNDFTLDNFKFQNLNIKLARNEQPSTINYFGNFFFNNNDYKNHTFIAHYGKGFDFHPVAGWCLEHNVTPNTINNANKINYMKILSTRFIDSINFTVSTKSFSKNIWI